MDDDDVLACWLGDDVSDVENHDDPDYYNDDQVCRVLTVLTTQATTDDVYPEILMTF